MRCPICVEQKLDHVPNFDTQCCTVGYLGENLAESTDLVSQALHEVTLFETYVSYLVSTSSFVTLLSQLCE